MQTHPTPDAFPRPVLPVAAEPTLSLPSTPTLSGDRAADLDRHARAACITRVMFGQGLRRDQARLIVNDVIDTYQDRMRRSAC